MLRFLTAGESHGQGLIAVLEGMPAGLTLDLDAITIQLRRRQGGYGRGRRMAIESDCAQVFSGVRRSKTTGGPIALLIPNKDWQNWQKTMHVEAEMPEEATGANRAPVTRPRPGHADLAGALKYGHDDIRDVLERASARETAARVALGAVARQLLGRFGIEVMSHVTRIGPVGIDEALSIDVDRIRSIPDDSPLHCADLSVEQQMIAAIDAAKEAGDTLGGAFEVVVTGLPVGLGSYVQWDRKLDGRLAQAVMSIPAIKAVGIGKGPDVARLPGSRIHDEIVPAGDQPSGHPAVGVSRLTNNAGGLEGGVTNGEQLRVTGYMKPIATLMQPLRSVDLSTMTESPAAIERSDVCAVTAAAVVGEAMVALTVADAFLEKFGNDNITDIAKVLEAAVDSVRSRFSSRSTPAPARS
jgi:chorismate synthase